MLSRLGRLGVERPRVMLGLWLALVGVLAALGGGVADRLHSSSVLVPGTKAAHAADVQDARFGERNAVIVLLQAPTDRIEAEGRALTRRLRPSATSRSPGRGAGCAREPPGRAPTVRC